MQEAEEATDFGQITAVRMEACLGFDCGNRRGDRIGFSSINPSDPRRSYKPVIPPWMADPELDSGFVYNEQGFVDILRSPFFNVNLEVENTIEEYVEHIIFTISDSIEEQICNQHGFCVSLAERRTTTPCSITAGLLPRTIWSPVPPPRVIAEMQTIRAPEGLKRKNIVKGLHCLDGSRSWRTRQSRPKPSSRTEPATRTKPEEEDKALPEIDGRRSTPIVWETKP
ncbi:hypothetical protein M5K25_026819 [Dendrobium thyrsiflorum]|uniref:Uncharacterized protein n=1 Tax=Dendrobium thyrsiflorum TaxID=117978 RepID=A0ABD0TYP2_DENTH